MNQLVVFMIIIWAPILLFSFILGKLLYQIPAIIVSCIGFSFSYYGHIQDDKNGTGFEGAGPIFTGYFIILLGIVIGIVVLRYEKK